jgi:hypothetical protein
MSSRPFSQECIKGDAQYVSRAFSSIVVETVGKMALSGNVKRNFLPIFSVITSTCSFLEELLGTRSRENIIQVATNATTLLNEPGADGRV